MTEDKKNIKKDNKDSAELKSADSTTLNEDLNDNPLDESSDDKNMDVESKNSDIATSSEDVPATSEKNNEDPESMDNNGDDNISLPFILGKKIGMTQLFSDNGTVFPATIIECGPCYITQIKSNSNDGYESLQLGFMDKKASKTTSALNGHFKKSGVSPKKYLKEFRYSNLDSDLIGKKVLVSQFDQGDFVTITGISKGKGFAGHMKRHNFSGGRASHGKNSVMRKAGSIGAGTSPGRVWKGTRMAGRMGNDKVTIKNLEIIKINNEKNIIFIKGSIPGANNNIVYIMKSNYES